MDSTMFRDLISFKMFQCCLNTEVLTQILISVKESIIVAMSRNILDAS